MREYIENVISAHIEELTNMDTFNKVMELEEDQRSKLKEMLKDNLDE